MTNLNYFKTFHVELRSEEKIGKFGFTSLGIVEVILEKQKSTQSYVNCIIAEKHASITWSRTQNETASHSDGSKSVSVNNIQ